MTTLGWTRQQLIDDLSKAFRENNDLATMTNAEVIAAWKRLGIHAGTEDWDDVKISE